MLLAEELALVALRPETGRFRVGSRTELNACLAGLLVGELLLDGRLEPGNGDNLVVPAPARPLPESPVLVAATEVATQKGPKLKAVLSHMSRGLEQRLGLSTRDAVLEGLSRAGVVERVEGGLRPRWPLRDHPARSSIVDRLRVAAAGDGPIEPPTALLLAMTGPAKLLEVVAPERSTRTHARHRIDHALDGSPLAAVAKVVRKHIQAAAMLAAGAG
jgi:hypothetical protein